MELDDKLAAKIHSKSEEPSLESITAILEQEDLLKQNQRDLRNVMMVDEEQKVDKRKKAITCFRCAGSGHLNRDCKMKPEDCFCEFCKMQGHLTIACRKKKREKDKKKKEHANQVGQQSPKTPVRPPTRPPTPVGEGEEEEEAFLIECSVFNTESQGQHSSLVRVPLDVMNSRTDSRGKVASAVLDTGCTVNLISDKLSNRINLRLKQCGTILSNASGTQMDVAGEGFLWI